MQVCTHSALLDFVTVGFAGTVLRGTLDTPAGMSIEILTIMIH